MIYCNWFGLILCVSWWINACCVFYTLHVYFGKMAYDLICFSLSFKILYFTQLWCTTKSFVLLNPLDIQIFWYWVNKYNNHNSLHNNLFIFIEQLMQEKKANKKKSINSFTSTLPVFVSHAYSEQILQVQSWKIRIECGELWYWYVLIVISQFAGIRQLLVSKYGLYCLVIFFLGNELRLICCNIALLG